MNTSNLKVVDEKERVINNLFQQIGLIIVENKTKMI